MCNQCDSINCACFNENSFTSILDLKTEHSSISDMRFRHVTGDDSYDSNQYSGFEYICGHCNMFHCSCSDSVLVRIIREHKHK